VSHPPLVPLVLRIGITGHRPDPAKRPGPDGAAIRAVLGGVLETVRHVAERIARARTDLYAPPVAGGPALDCHVRLVSALASGPDQWAASEAVSLGIDLQCVLPFPREAYKEDFRQSAGQGHCDEEEFAALLGAASAVFELDGRVVRSEEGDRLPDGDSYRAAGSTILRQSDLLIAVWDGEPARGTGGTGEIVDEALARGIPVAWIPWERPEGWRLLLPAWRDPAAPVVSEAGPADLPRVAEALLLPPDEIDGDAAAGRERLEYFLERRPRSNALRWCWGVFTRVAAAGSDPEAAPRAGGTAAHSGADAVQAFADRSFLCHYRWANDLSIHYGHLHRGSALVVAALAAAAVFLALYSIAAGLEGGSRSPWILAELIVILAIMVLARLGRRRRWHQRWIDYRMLAERLRVARCASPLGGGSPLVGHAGHQASYGNPLRTWMHWHCRAIEGAAGLPRAIVEGGYLEACRALWVEDLLEGQRRYHERTASLFSALDRRLHRAGDALFGLTLVACLLHLAHLRLEGSTITARMGDPSGWLTLLCAFLPAAGAAAAAVRGFAETQRVAQRSKAMRDALARLQADLSSVPVTCGALNLQRLRACADRVSDLMIRETLDWRVVFQDRPLNLPG